MINPTFIETYCKIQDGKVSLDGKVVYANDIKAFPEFSKGTYNFLEVNYTKFFKMDSVSKLAFIGAELILKTEIGTQKNQNIALLFANRSSSLDTDVKHQQSISDKQNYFPSPAVFVYTLPNICLGEISIRHQLKSENSFFIFDAFNTTFMAAYANILLETKKADKVLCGWVEYFEESYTAFCYLVSKQGTIHHNPQTLEILFNK